MSEEIKGLIRTCAKYGIGSDKHKYILHDILPAIVEIVSETVEVFGTKDTIELFEDALHEIVYCDYGQGGG